MKRHCAYCPIEGGVLASVLLYNQQNKLVVYCSVYFFPSSVSSATPSSVRVCPDSNTNTCLVTMSSAPPRWETSLFIPLRAGSCSGHRGLWPPAGGWNQGNAPCELHPPTVHLRALRTDGRTDGTMSSPGFPADNSRGSTANGGAAPRYQDGEAISTG